MDGTAASAKYIGLAAEIVSAYVSRNSVSASELPALLGEVHSVLAGIGSAPSTPAPARRPAVSPGRSVFNDYLVCLEDGKEFKSLRRHLRTRHELSPEEYRRKWGLPLDYPMVAPNYAKTRSALAKRIGLGQQAHRPGISAGET